MEQEIGNISIALIRKLNPAMKGIGNDFIMDSTEYYIPDVNSIFKYPLRLDGIIIAVRKQGSATIEEFYKLKYCSTVVYMVPRA